MTTIEITDEQREYLEDLRERLEDEVVGPYGHVRPSDALQYLIDSHEGDLELGEGSNPASVGGTGDADGDDAADDANSDVADDAAASSDADGDDADAGDADSDDTASASGPTPSPGGGSGGRLSAMMQLLDTHDDKWRESDGDARYEVDLPDGSTEQAQTKDDVRALLFKNY